jgi:hypothetical protein
VLQRVYKRLITSVIAGEEFIKLISNLFLTAPYMSLFFRALRELIFESEHQHETNYTWYYIYKSYGKHWLYNHPHVQCDVATKVTKITRCVLLYQCWSSQNKMTEFKHTSRGFFIYLDPNFHPRREFNIINGEHHALPCSHSKCDFSSLFSHICVFCLQQNT